MASHILASFFGSNYVPPPNLTPRWGVGPGNPVITQAIRWKTVLPPKLYKRYHCLLK